MASLGAIEQFDPAMEEWPEYVQRLQQFYVANDMVDEGKADKRCSTYLDCDRADTLQAATKYVVSCQAKEDVRGTYSGFDEALQSNTIRSDADIPI